MHEQRLLFAEEDAFAYATSTLDQVHPAFDTDCISSAMLQMKQLTYTVPSSLELLCHCSQLQDAAARCVCSLTSFQICDACLVALMRHARA